MRYLSGVSEKLSISIIAAYFSIKSASALARDFAEMLPCQQAHKQRLVRPARDECGGVSRQLGTESDVSWKANRDGYRTAKMRIQCTLSSY